MKQILLPAVLFTLVITVLTGFIYPLMVTGLSQAIFHHQANGSLIDVNGKVVGSELIGQKFTKPEYFHGRPSAAGDGYDAANSGATNLGPTNQNLINRVRDDIKKFRQGESHLHRTDSSRFADYLCQRPRSAYQSGIRLRAGRPCGHSPSQSTG